MIGIRVFEIENITYDSLDNFSFHLDMDKHEIQVFHLDKYLGTFQSQIGMDEDEFIRNAKVTK